MLTEYKDQELCDLIEFGFPLGFHEDINAPVGIRPHDTESACTEHFEFGPQDITVNHKGAIDYPKQMDEYLKREVEAEAILGPLEVNPLSTPIKLSPLNSVPKRDSKERRIILDLSLPKGKSVNAHIPKDTYLGKPINLTYPRVDDLVELVKEKGKGCHLFKRDLKRAYRQIPIDPGDIHLVGYMWSGKIYLDRVLSMGLRSAAYICQRLTSAVSFICLQAGYYILNYLDDFGGAEEQSKSKDAFEYLGAVLHNCGLVESLEKAVPPSTRMVFLGVLFDTENLTLEVPSFRLQEIMDLLVVWLDKEVASLQHIQSLLGKLMFVASCVRQSRIFISRLLNWLRDSTRSKTDQRVPLEVKKDLLWWKEFLLVYNGVSMMSLEEWSVPDDEFASDACLSGCGGFFKGQSFHTKFPDFILKQDLSINCLELLTVVVCAKLWGHKCRGKKIVINCDNSASVAVINSGKSRVPFMQACLREISFHAAIHEFELRASHIEGESNRIPDHLSRWHLDPSHGDKFHELTKGMEITVHPLEEDTFKFSHIW
ncbi:uncharacterized protein LOC110451275 [Mizuhopecten yessoensis]|uniref:uncharacterized protein LOC110451275 n=1 Tax=Mizuhopecten yessoensis TaxID=6573 RepID=UPI000B459E51|nr:uncharacterized protein LOC110451275 [Mizuhopecten yessoensis]